MKLAEGTAEQGKEYDIRIGRKEGLLILGITPPPEIISTEAIRKIIENKQDSVITGEGERQTSKGEPYYEFECAKLTQLDLIEIGHRAVAAIVAQGGDASIGVEVMDLDKYELYPSDRNSFGAIEK